jgi:hypothetical protein
MSVLNSKLKSKHGSLSSDSEPCWSLAFEPEEAD